MCGLKRRNWGCFYPPHLPCFCWGNLIRLLQPADKSENSFLFICVCSAFPVIDFGCKERYSRRFCRLFLLPCVCVISEGPAETWFQKVLLLERGLLLVSSSLENSWLTLWSHSNYQSGQAGQGSVDTALLAHCGSRSSVCGAIHSFIHLFIHSIGVGMQT